MFVRPFWGTQIPVPGPRDGIFVGMIGAFEGANVGETVGALLGVNVGALDGVSVGLPVGDVLGGRVGFPLGFVVGWVLGFDVVGDPLGLPVVGVRVGARVVGACVTTQIPVEPWSPVTVFKQKLPFQKHDRSFLHLLAHLYPQKFEHWHPFSSSVSQSYRIITLHKNVHHHQSLENMLWLSI